MAFSFFKKTDSSSKSATPANEKYYHLKVKEVIRETSDAINIVFEKPAKAMSYKSGQFLTLIETINGEKVRRAYSLSSSPFVDEFPAVAVKKVEGGRMSTWLNDSLKAGASIEVMEPMGTFLTEYNTNNKRHIVLLGGGSGITPLISIMKSTLSQEPQSSVSLIYTNRNEESIIFKAELVQLLQQYGERLHIVNVLDNPPAGWTGPSGIPTVELLTKILKDLGADKDAEYFICGPGGMMDNAEKALLDAGTPKNKIRKESFTNSADKKPTVVAAHDDSAGFEVKVIYDGEEHVFTVPNDKAILETALSLDIDLPYSCQSGLCTACRGKCVSGKVRLDESEGLSQSELNEGYVLTCVGHPISDGVVIEIG